VIGSFKLVRRSKDGRWAVMPVVDWSRGLLDAWIVEIATDLARRVAALDATRGLPVFSPGRDRLRPETPVDFSRVALMPQEQVIEWPAAVRCFQPQTCH